VDADEMWLWFAQAQKDGGWGESKADRRTALLASIALQGKYTVEDCMDFLRPSDRMDGDGWMSPEAFFGIVAEKHK
jgi:hypothetical protein